MKSLSLVPKKISITLLFSLANASTPNTCIKQPNTAKYLNKMHAKIEI